MRKALVFLIGLLTLAVAVAACSGSKNNNSTPTPTPSPTPGSFSYTIGSTGWPHSHGGQRVIQTNGGAGRSVVFCTVSSNLGSSWSVTSAGLLSSTYDYHFEVFGSLVNSTAYHAGDHSWWYSRGAGTTTNTNIIFPHSTSTILPITWKPGTGCPGD